MTPADLTPGTRVVVQHSGHLNGQSGVVVGSREGMDVNYEVVILLDKGHGLTDCELGFYAHELAVEK